MNFKEGRIGVQEGVSICTISMATSGLFTLDSAVCYQHGNSTYITFPAAALLTLGFFLIIVSVIKRSGADNLTELFAMALGHAGAAVTALILMLCFIWAAYLPLSRFVQAMHGLFYEGVSYVKLTMFILPAVLILCLFGFETIGRTAKCFSLFLLLILIAAIITASEGFEAYRLYPLLGNGAKEIAANTFSEMSAFLPGMLTMLILCDGLNGIGTVKKAGIIAALITAGICFISQLTLGMVYTYSELSELFIPLYRLNHLSVLENSLMRFDKLAHIAWLNGSMLAGAFYIYGASILFCKTFNIKDIRPVLGSDVMLTIILILMEFSGSYYKLLPALNIMRDYGFLIISVPVIITVLTAALKSGRKNRKGSGGENENMMPIGMKAQ